MKIGIVGYQGSGKSTLFEWLTGVAHDPAQSHTGQTAMAAVPEPRVRALCDIYHPKKVTLASLELVDTPGLNRTHEGNAARLGLIRDSGALAIVLAAFEGSDPMADLRRFEEDQLLADLEIVSGRIDRLRESVKKPRPNRDQELAELAALEAVQAALEAGAPLRESGMSDDQLKATRSFRLLTEKPRLVLVNAADDETDLDRFAAAAPEGVRVLGVRIGLERELEKMADDERAAFEQEMGVESQGKDGVLRAILDASGQMLYFTAGDKEVRTWMLRKGGTALEAAANIHSDLARGFIRSETMRSEDLIRLGGEREIKAANLMRSEPKDYVVQEGDILHIRFSV